MSYLYDAVSQEGGLGRILCQSDASKDEKEGEKISWARATVSPKLHPTRIPGRYQLMDAPSFHTMRAVDGFSEGLERSTTTSLGRPLPVPTSLLHLLPHLPRLTYTLTPNNRQDG